MFSAMCVCLFTGVGYPCDYCRLIHTCSLGYPCPSPAPTHMGIRHVQTWEPPPPPADMFTKVRLRSRRFASDLEALEAFLLRTDPFDVLITGKTFSLI